MKFPSNLLSPVLALLAACAFLAAMKGGDDPQATKPVVSDIAPTDTRPMIRMKISGHKTDSMERRYNIVDSEDLQMAKELLQNRRRTPENTNENVTNNVTTAGKTAIQEDTGAAEK
jgi:hypothetical protein